MTDDGLSERPPSGLFFAGSQDGDEDVPMDRPESPPVSSRASSPANLFLPDSEDDHLLPNDIQSPSLNKRKMSTSEHETDDDILVSSPISIPRDLANPQEGPTNIQSSVSEVPHVAAEPRSKKPRTTEPSSAISEFQPTYLGEVLVPNAWSNVSGKGYIECNDPVKIYREVTEGFERYPKKANVVQGTKGKQLSLKTMLKPLPPKTKKKAKEDQIVRLANSRGTEFGRLPTDVSWWISKLLDLGIVEFRGTMTDCPDRLSIGVTLFVTLQVFVLAAAFKPPSVSNTRETPSIMFNEGQETVDEKSLRERKQALLQLFDVVGLKPSAGPTVMKDVKLNDDIRKRLAKYKTKKVTEIVGDDEEIEVDDGEDLSKNEIDTIYQKAQHLDRSLGTMDPADTFTLTLRSYQKQALLWMHSLESGKMNARESSSIHPLWSQYFFPQMPVMDGNTIDLSADEKPFYLNPYSGEMSLEFPKQERKFRGGILADVGMGKTIMVSALLHTSPPLEKEDEPLPAPKPRQLKLNDTFRPVMMHNRPLKSSSATLIVAPTSLLAQWSEELERSSKPGTVKVFVWHGQNRLDLESMVENGGGDDETIKVVVTSYGVLASEHAMYERSGNRKSSVFEINWLRVVLDEAHSCKSRTSKTAKAAYALQARRRWTVTGTPIVNRLEDLYSLLKFLRFKPWSDFAFFRSFITLPFLARDPKAIEIVQVILESVLLRREKNMRDANGRRIVELPTKEVLVETLEFSPLERKIYDSIYISAKKKFERLDAKGLVSKNYTHILAMLMRLRRAVLHSYLVITPEDHRALSPSGDPDIDVNELLQRFAEAGSDNSNSYAEEVLAKLTEKEVGECPICLDVMEIPMIIPGCMHQCCKDCILAHLATCEERHEESRCPTCARGPIKASELLEVVRRQDHEKPLSQASQPEVTLRRNDFFSSTKLEALLKSLKRLRNQDPCFRAVVFSQFTSFMDLIETALQRERFEHYRFDGTMDVKKKNAVISGFRIPSRKPKVLVVSLKAGGVGLNLTTANHVFMMDCWWNSAIENQAIDRVHRIGQEKTVYVTHFIVANTIEGRILKIQKRKTAIVKEAFRGSDTKTDPDSIENLKIMFGHD